MQRFLNDKFPTENRSTPLATWKKIFLKIKLDLKIQLEKSRSSKPALLPFAPTSNESNCFSNASPPLPSVNYSFSNKYLLT